MEKLFHIHVKKNSHASYEVHWLHIHSKYFTYMTNTFHLHYKKNHMHVNFCYGTSNISFTWVFLFTCTSHIHAVFVHILLVVLSYLLMLILSTEQNKLTTVEWHGKKFLSHISYQYKQRLRVEIKETWLIIINSLYILKPIDCHCQKCLCALIKLMLVKPTIYMHLYIVYQCIILSFDYFKMHYS